MRRHPTTDSSGHRRYTQEVTGWSGMKPQLTRTGSFISRSASSYEIVELLGAGGMGVVYRAMDRRLDRPVALKFLSSVDPEDHVARERFIREARAASALDHPNIGTIFGIEEGPDGELCIVMAYHDGETVADLARRGPVRSSEAVRIAAAAADGLAAAHARGIIHRDIKPSNIMVTRAGVVKIVDFGLARITGADTTVTAPAAVMGTAAYMAPEQARGFAADTRSDIWSLGAVLYELLAGKRAFSGTDVLAQVYAVANYEPEPVDGLPPALERVLRKALAKNPEQRYATMHEFAAELRRAIPEASAPIPMVPTRRVRPAWIAAGAAAVLLLLGTLTVPAVRERLPFTSRRIEPITVVFLPFTNAQDPATAALATGLAEQLGTTIRSVQRFSDALNVVTAGEAMSRSVQDVTEARRELGATVVISGVLRRKGDTGELEIRIDDQRRREPMTVQYAGSFGNLGRTAVAGIANMLDLRVAAAQGPIVPAAAQEPYLRGLGYLQRWDRSENLDAAITSFGEALRIQPNFTAAYVGLAEASRTKFRTDKDPVHIQHALNYARQSVGLDDRTADAHVVLGRVYQDTGQRDLAVIEFQRALELDRRSVAALTGMGKAWEDLGRLGEAETALRQASDSNPYAWSPLNTLGSFYIRRSRYAEAEACFRKALTLTPDNPALHTNLGVVLQRQKRSDEAVAAFRRSIEVSPSYAAWLNLGNLLYSRRDFKGAADSYGRALQLNGRDFRTWGSLAQALRLSGGSSADVSAAYRRAIALAEEMQRVSPGQPRTTSLLAIYCAALGHSAAALHHLAGALAAGGSDRDVLIDAAIAYGLLGRRQDAVMWAERALAAGEPWTDLREDPDLESLIRSGALKRPENM